MACLCGRSGTLNKLGEAKISDTDNLQTKQLRFICYMLQLMYDLMLSESANVPEIPFKSFIGRLINLRSNDNR